ncbi:hypothetical protein AAH678_12515 [Sodalis endosymbiont of Spalangia cameroni]|uniref:hypothetical protein n=1 Tax=Sodalis praecaptivus TaxID=1239307 RepID=UPI0031F9BAFB
MSHAVYARALSCRRRSTGLRAQPLCLRPKGRTWRLSWRQRKARLGRFFWRQWKTRVGRYHSFNSDDVTQSSLDRLRRLAARQRQVPHLMPTVTDNLTGIGAAAPRARPFYTEIIL